MHSLLHSLVVFALLEFADFVQPLLSFFILYALFVSFLLLFGHSLQRDTAALFARTILVIIVASELAVLLLAHFVIRFRLRLLSVLLNLCLIPVPQQTLEHRLVAKLLDLVTICRCVPRRLEGLLHYSLCGVPTEFSQKTWQLALRGLICKFFRFGRLFLLCLLSLLDLP